MRKTLSVLLAIAMLFTMCVPAMATDVSNTVPEGGTYYVGVTSTTLGDYATATATYASGETMPAASNGDVFVLGDYEYRYGYEYDASNKWVVMADAGWGVRALDASKTEYSQIYSSVNGVNVVSARSIFSNCTSLVTAPTIPDTVTNMRTAFYYCSALTTATLPTNTISLQSTFAGCSSLINAPIIPDTVTHMGSAFDSCTSLRVAPEIPYGVENMRRAFFGCTKLTTGPSTIPSTVTTMEKTFYNCKNLATAPAIPGSVTDISYTFYNSKKLDSVEVNCNPTSYAYFIKNTEIGDVTGSTEIREELLATNTIHIVPEGGIYYVGVPSSNTVGNYEGATSTLEAGAAIPRIQRLDRYVYGDYEYQCVKSGSTKYWQVKVLDDTKAYYGEILSSINEGDVKSMNYTFKDCANMVTGPMIPETVTSMMGTFLNCTSLEEVGFLPEGLTEMRRIFMGCEKLSMFPTTQPLPAGVTSMIYSFYNCKSLTEIPAIPESVDNLYYAFYNCKGLKSVEVEGNPTHYSKAFFRSGVERILGATTMKAELLGTNGIVYEEVASDIVVPENGLYYVGVSTSNEIGNYTGYTAIYESGDMFPTIEQGDRFVLGDYEYLYDGITWNVEALDKTQTSYGEIVSRINGVNVTTMIGTFWNCTALEVAPAIPETVTTLSMTFQGCTSLVSAPVIESNITTMHDTFYGCTSLSGALEVNGVPSLYGNCLYGTQITEITGSTTEFTKTMLLLSVEGKV